MPREAVSLGGTLLPGGTRTPCPSPYIAPSPMCGRIALYTPPLRMARLLDATLAAGLDPERPPSWNVGPTRTLLAMTEPADDAGRHRVLDEYRWG